MQPRLFDERVGYFLRPADRLRAATSTARPAAATSPAGAWRSRIRRPPVSDPVKPITYWIDPATPAKWVPYIRQGVEAWQPAFEAAGFSNAVVARRGPDAGRGPRTGARRMHATRSSAGLPSTVENASGPHVHDPRTGEILEADIQFHHNVMNLVRDWYFVQVGPLDPRARTLPLPPTS